MKAPASFLSSGTWNRAHGRSAPSHPVYWRIRQQRHRIISSLRASSGLYGYTLLLFAATRAMLILTATGVVSVLGSANYSIGPKTLWLDVLSRWDGQWYFRIANDGYHYVAGQQSNVSFAPLFPGITHFIAGLTGRSDADTIIGVGVLVSNLAALAAVVLLARLVSERWGVSVAKRTVLCLLVFPTSFFLSAMYAESLFLALSLGALMAADKGYWWLAGVLAALTTLTRLQGFLIVIPLAWLYFERRRFKVDVHVLWLGLALLAVCGWLAYMYGLSGDLLAPLHSQNASGRQIEAPWDGISGSFTSIHNIGTLGHFAVDTTTILAFGALVVFFWRNAGSRYLASFASVFYAAIIATGTVESASRYALELFPAFIVLGQLTKRRVALAAYVVIAGSLSLVAVAHFAMGFWVA